jgi:hypothetical protein
MKRSFLWLCGMAVLLLAPPASRAGSFLLSVTTSADPNHLHVGDKVTFGVTLSGVDAADPTTYLSYLAATVQYDPTLLSPNPSISPGAIVPDLTGFVGTPLSSGADAFYDGVFLASTPISGSGTFYSFDVTPTAPGSGSLSFSAVAATLASDPNQNDQFTPDTRGLDFQVEGPAGSVVPEPGTWILLLLGGLGACAPLGRRHAFRVLRGLAVRPAAPLG